jgi:hypothetical protein
MQEVADVQKDRSECTGGENSAVIDLTAAGTKRLLYE